MNSTGLTLLLACFLPYLMWFVLLIFSDNVCLSNEKCIRGICRVVCNSNEACSEGYICDGRICKQGCRDDNECDINQACLNGQCKGMNGFIILGIVV